MVRVQTVAEGGGRVGVGLGEEEVRTAAKRMEAPAVVQDLAAGNSTYQNCNTNVDCFATG